MFNFLQIFAQSRGSYNQIGGLTNIQGADVVRSGGLPTIINGTIFIVASISVLWSLVGWIVGIIIYRNSKSKHKLLWALLCGLPGPILLFICLIAFTLFSVFFNLSNTSVLTS